MFHSGRAAAVAAWLVLAAVGESRAAHFWSNPAGGLYSDAGNWMGGVPVAGQPVFYEVDGTYTVDVDVSATHGATQFAADNADVTLNITGAGYSIPALVKIGSAGTTNNVSVGGSTFTTGNVEIAPVGGSVGSLTLSGPMDAEIISVGGQIMPPGPPGPPWPTQTTGGSGMLTLNPGANLTASALLAESASFGSEIVFNGGTMTIAGHARPGSKLDRIGDGTNSAVLNLYNGTEPSAHDFGNGTLTISNNAVVNYDSPDGSLNVGAITLESGATPGVFNWIAGYIGLNSSSLEIGTNGVFGANLELTPVRRLSTQGVVVTNGASLTLAGGELYTDSFATNPGGTFTYDNGFFFIYTGDLEVGPNGITNPGVLSLNEFNDFIGIEAGDLTIAAGRSVVLNGGGFRANAVINDGDLAFNSGAIDVTDGGLTIGPTGQLNASPNISIGANSQIRTYYDELVIEGSQSVSIDGGALIAGYLTNHGTLFFNSGVLAVTQSSLTIGPSGQLRLQPVLTLDNGSSIQMSGQAITIEAAQTVNVLNGFIQAGSIDIEGTLNVNGSVSATTVTSGPTSMVTVGNGGSLGGKFVRKDFIVNGGTAFFTEMSTSVGGMHDNSLILNSGSVYADTMKVGAAPGFVDTVTINGGQFTTANLEATGGASSVIIFKAGQFTSFKSNVDGPGTFVVGDGSSDASFYIGGGGVHNFADGLAISPNASFGGGGTINGDVSNAGTMEPGNSYGTLAINGDFANTGIMQFEFHNVLPFLDKVVVNGTFEAGGVLKVRSYDPDIGDSYDLMDFTNLLDNGFAFDFSLTTLPAGGHWDTSAFATTGQIYIVADNGDFNNDGVVDMADYVAWSKGAGVPPTAGNFDLWRGHFGESSGAGSDANGTVPEASSFALLLIGEATMIWLRRGGRGEPRR
jgi:hypothetical protein